MSDTTTLGVRITVRPQFIAERSKPGDNIYFFAYHVCITNGSDDPVQLISRHWVITDGSGNEDEVRGPGVVGEQPHLRPGESFEYSSACPLTTAVGTMHGSFRMLADSGEQFDAIIAPFALACPGAVH